jgi:hypothetical protein
VDDFEALRYKEDLEYTVPQLTEVDNVMLQLQTRCPERGGLIPVWRQVNEILGNCFARTPEDRVTAIELMLRFVGMRKALCFQEGKVPTRRGMKATFQERHLGALTEQSKPKEMKV